MSYSLWLSVRPQSLPVHKQLSAEIATQAKEHGAPLFEPHVTLLGGIHGELDAIAATAAQLAASTKVGGLGALWRGGCARGGRAHSCTNLHHQPSPQQAFRVNFLDVAQGSSFHRCVYLLVAQEAPVMAAGQAARHAYGVDGDPAYMPHCSLLYADLAPEARAAAAHAAVQRLYGEGASYGTLLTDAGFKADTLTLWHTPVEDTSLASWKQVEEFKLAAE
jgi:hypothetical protein